MCKRLGRFIIVVAAMSAPALAGVTVNVTSYPSDSNITAWPVGCTDTSAANPSAYGQVENNYGGAPTFSLAQSWTATTGGNLSHVQIVIAGAPPVSFNINLYDGGVSDSKKDSPTDWSDVGGNTYKPGVNVSQNLFSSSLAVTWTGFKDSNDQVAVLDFAFDGADQVAIQAGHQYIFEIASESELGNLTWFRNASEATNYTGGQAFRQRSPLNGNPARDFTLAVTVGREAATAEKKDVNEKPAAPAAK